MTTTVAGTPGLPVKATQEHPYPIRTTSTALLTRSNSVGARPDKSSTFYSPNSPSTSSPALGRQGRGHRHTKSLSNAPPPLPMPPSPSSPSFSNDLLGDGTISDGGVPIRSVKLKRSNTLPSFPTSRSDTESKKVNKSFDLPENPKMWTPSHLSVYLSSALRLKNGGDLPAPVAKDIAAFVVEKKLSGRTFLRLTEEDLEGMGINQLWRAALFAASRTLRKNVLQGRIWGFGSPGVSDSPRRIPSTVEEDSEENPAPNPRPVKSYRGGRVRGMVESFERSGSYSSASESEKEDISLDIGAVGVWPPLPPDSDDEDIGFASGELTSPDASENEEDTSLVSPLDPAAQQAELPRSQSPASSSDIEPEALDTPPPVANADEPSIEDLLEQAPSSQGQGSWGHKAWEYDLGPGDTAKKVTTAAPSLLQVFARQDTAEEPLAQDSVPGDAPASAETFDPRDLLEAFTRRLEEVERKLDEMEQKDVQREMQEQEWAHERSELLQKDEERKIKEQEWSREKLELLEKEREWEREKMELLRQKELIESELKRAHAERKPLAADSSPQDSAPPMATTSVPGASTPLSIEHCPSSRSEDKGKKSEQNEINDPTAGGLASYVLFVGLGVAVVVLRVVFRKIGGKKVPFA